MKLRGEVGLLRQQTNRLHTLQDQNQQLRIALISKNISQNSPATNVPAKASPLAVYPKASWAFAGYATPEAAFQSLNWASANGDLNRLLDGSTPDMQTEIARQFANKSESDIADEIRKHFNKNTEVSILQKDVHSDTEVVLTVLGDAAGTEGNNTPANLLFQNHRPMEICQGRSLSGDKGALHPRQPRRPARGRAARRGGTEDGELNALRWNFSCRSTSAGRRRPVTNTRHRRSFPLRSEERRVGKECRSR